MGGRRNGPRWPVTAHYTVISTLGRVYVYIWCLKGSCKQHLTIQNLPAFWRQLRMCRRALGMAPLLTCLLHLLQSQLKMDSRSTWIALGLLLLLCSCPSPAHGRMLRADTGKDTGRGVPRQGGPVFDGATTNVDWSRIAVLTAEKMPVLPTSGPCGCPRVPQFVCAANNITYGNQCLGLCAGAKGPFRLGGCP